jgi:hypothetical protein
MRAFGAGLFFLWIVVLGPGCFEDKCKNPQRTVDGDVEGPALKCNAVMRCQHGGRFDAGHRLTNLEDPTIVDRHFDSTNKERCRNKAIKNLADQFDSKHCDIEVSPTPICLDASGAPDGSGPDVSGPTGGTLVTVGVGAGSGDYYFQAEGEGGAGGYQAEPGAGGEGGM